jgi:hypothetical protein
MNYGVLGRKFFYNAYHCLVFLDYYLTYPANPDFSSPLPFTLAEEGVVVQDAIDDIIPDRIYSKEELLEFLSASREKCLKLISGLTDDNINDRWIIPSWNMNFFLFWSFYSKYEDMFSIIMQRN